MDGVGGAVVVVALVVSWWFVWRWQVRTNRRFHFARTGQQTFANSTAAFKARDFEQAEAITRADMEQFQRPIPATGLHAWHLNGLNRFSALALVGDEPAARALAQDVLESLGEILRDPNPPMKSDIEKFRADLTRLLGDSPLNKTAIHRWIVTGRI